MKNIICEKEQCSFLVDDGLLRPGLELVDGALQLLVLPRPLRRLAQRQWLPASRPEAQAGPPDTRQLAGVSFSPLAIPAISHFSGET